MVPTTRHNTAPLIMNTTPHRSATVNVDRVAEVVPEWHGDFDVTLTTGAKLRMSRTHR